MKVVVNRGSGFLGSHVVPRLVDDGLEVTSFHLRPVEKPGIRSILGDLLDGAAVNLAVSGHDSVCHPRLRKSSLGGELDLQ